MSGRRRLVVQRGLRQNHQARNSSRPNSPEFPIHPEISGFGVEKDIRDGNGALVTLNDPGEVVQGSAAAELLDPIREDFVLAENLKSTGVAELLPLEARKLDGFFFFDLPFPEELILQKRVV